MKTKSFSVWYGEESLTREQFIQEWLESTHKYVSMFSNNDMAAELIDFQTKVVEFAGKQWDSK